MPLNARQQRFVDELIRCGNASEAYRTAYETDNVEASNAAAARLLANVSVREAVEAGRRVALEQVGLTREKWAREVALVAFSDVTHYGADRQGKLTTSGPEGSTRAVSSVKVRCVTTGRGAARRTTTETEIKLWSKPETLRMAGQALDILKGKLEITGNLADLTGLSDDELAAMEAELDRRLDAGTGAPGEGPPPVGAGPGGEGAAPPP